MSSSTTTPTLQACRECGAGAPLDAHFCPQCTKILPLPRQADYFSFLGLPRKLNIDAADLEQRFRALSRQFHPDYFYNATPAERRASLERSSYLNDAYRTLRQPIDADRVPAEAGRARRIGSGGGVEAGAARAARGSVRAERGARRDSRAACGRGAGGGMAGAARARASADRGQADSSTKRNCRSWRRSGTPAAASDAC